MFKFWERPYCTLLDILLQLKKEIKGWNCSNKQPMSSNVNCKFVCVGRGSLFCRYTTQQFFAREQIETANIGPDYYIHMKEYASDQSRI